MQILYNSLKDTGNLWHNVHTLRLPDGIVETIASQLHNPELKIYKILQEKDTLSWSE